MRQSNVLSVMCANRNTVVFVPKVPSFPLFPPPSYTVPTHCVMLGLPPPPNNPLDLNKVLLRPATAEAQAACERSALTLKKTFIFSHLQIFWWTVARVK